MALPRLALAVIGDEIGPSLSEMISFCTENDVHRLDMRTVEGKNLLGMTLDEIEGISKTLRQAGLKVPTFVSPVLKWPATGKAVEGAKVDFAFDPALCPTEDPLAHAFDVATVLGASRLRVFSHLRYPGYKPADLDTWTRRAQNFAAGAAPADLPRIADAPAGDKARDVFIYMIAGAKLRAPAAAMAMIERVQG